MSSIRINFQLCCAFCAYYPNPAIEIDLGNDSKIGVVGRALEILYRPTLISGSSKNVYVLIVDSQV